MYLLFTVINVFNTFANKTKIKLRTRLVLTWATLKKLSLIIHNELFVYRIFNGDWSPPAKIVSRGDPTSLEHLFSVSWWYNDALKQFPLFLNWIYFKKQNIRQIWTAYSSKRIIYMPFGNVLYTLQNELRRRRFYASFSYVFKN